MGTVRRKEKMEKRRLSVVATKSNKMLREQIDTNLRERQERIRSEIARQKNIRMWKIWNNLGKRFVKKMRLMKEKKDNEKAVKAVTGENEDLLAQIEEKK